MKNIIQTIRQQLTANADEKNLASSQRFFKEKIQFYGVKVPVVNKISKKIFKELAEFSKEGIFDLCEELWQSGYLEESFVACNWTYRCRKDFQPDDFERFKKWIDLYVNNWGSCDTFCNHTMGEFLAMYPDYLSDLIQFTASQNRWMRRAAAVSLIIPARKGMFLDSIFIIADNLLTDKDDLVQKGYGWMLKAASQAYQQQVFDYVMKNKSNMPRTALRYAIEKMPKEMQVQAMSK